jgi:hypothetical protein
MKDIYKEADNFTVPSFYAVCTKDVGFAVTYVFWANISIHMNSHEFLVITEEALY